MLDRFRDALARTSRDKPLTCPGELRLVERGGGALVQFRWMLAREQERAVLVDHCFSRTVDLARRGTDGLVNPNRMELRGSVRNRRMYEAHCGCPAAFDGHSLFRAFQGWQGVSPGEWRSRHARTPRASGRARAGATLELA
jgi:hypothetical protein